MLLVNFKESEKKSGMKSVLKKLQALVKYSAVLSNPQAPRKYTNKMILSRLMSCKLIFLIRTLVNFSKPVQFKNKTRHLIALNHSVRLDRQYNQILDLRAINYSLKI